MEPLKAFTRLRQALRCYLHQDFDLESKTLPDALASIMEGHEAYLLAQELEALERCSPEEIKEVLEDHDVYLWDMTTPQDFLVTLKTLSRLSM